MAGFVLALAGASMLLPAPAPAQSGSSGARGRVSGGAASPRSTPARSPARIGVVAPRPAAAPDHEPRLRPGRSITGGRTSLHAPPNVAHAANVGEPIPSLPGPSTRVRFGGRLFYYCLGGFYVRHAGGYEAVDPPHGAVVRTLPAGYETLKIAGRTVYYFDGVFYEDGRRRGEYVVVPAPAGAVVGQLPRDAVEIRSAAGVRYRAGGVVYVPVERGAETVYVVSGY